MDTSFKRRPPDGGGSGFKRPKTMVRRDAGLPEEAAPEKKLITNEGLDAGLNVPTGPEAPVMSTQLLAEARRAGLDLNTLAPDELDAFASGGVAGLTRYRAGIWDEEAEKRPAQPNVLV